MTKKSKHKIKRELEKSKKNKEKDKKQAISKPVALIFLCLAILCITQISARAVSCFQERTNGSYISDGTCNLNYSGNYSWSGNWFSSAFNGSKAFDNDYATAGASANFDLGFVNSTYILPDYNILNVSLFFKTYNGSAYTNLTTVLPRSCYDNKNYITIMMIVDGTGAKTINYFCYINSSTISPYLYYKEGSNNIYEEGINWTIDGADNYTINSLIYNNQTIEGQTENFKLNITVYDGDVLDTAYLNYNNTNYIATITNEGDNRILSRDLNIPYVNADTNISFFFILNFISKSINITTHNQTVKDITFDNCTTNTVRIYNLSMYDEETQVLLNGTADNVTIEADLTVSSMDLSNRIYNYTTTFYQKNPVGICSSINLTSNNLRVDMQLRYSSLNHVPEFYNIQNGTINNLTIPQVIRLYDLLIANSTTFTIIYKDENYNPVSDAVIIIKRKYISGGIFNIVEAPMTDISGQTIGHFDTNNVIYSIYVTKNGKNLSVFDNVIVVCENILIGDCKLNLIPTYTSLDVDDYNFKDGVYYSISFNKTSRELSADFSTEDNSVINMRMNATKYDSFLNDTACYDTLSSNIGTLSCILPITYGNTTIIVELYKDSELIAREIFSFKPDLSNIFTGDRIFFMLMFVIIIPLMFISSTIGILIGLVLSLILSSLLFLFYTDSIIGKASSIMWIIIAISIVIFKLSRRQREGVGG
jgi:hypothetical protein